MASQHHFRVCGEILVDHGRALGGIHLAQTFPLLACCFFARRALAKEDHVGNDFGSGVVLESGLREADSPDQIGALGEILAGAVVGLVHGPLGGDEHQQAARLHPVDGLGKEVVMEHKALLLVLRVALDLDGPEWRVADCGVEEITRQLGLGVVTNNHIAVWIEQLGNVAGDGVVLDPGVFAVAGDAVRHQAIEQADAHPRLQHVAAVEPHSGHGFVNTANDRLAGVVRVLGSAACLGVFFLGERSFKAFPQLTP